jgi:hypothetical protein
MRRFQFNWYMTASTTKNTVFWDVTPCSLVEICRRFGGTYFLHLQVVEKSIRVQLAVCLLWELLYLEDGGITFIRIIDKHLQNRGYFPKLH